MATLPLPSYFEGRLEPEADMAMQSAESCSLRSIAISLKRIADTLDGTAAGICVTQTIFGRTE